MTAHEMRESIRKHSAKIRGRTTSFSLEDGFYDALKDIALERQTTVQTLIAEVDDVREDANLSSSLRLFVISHFRAKAAAERTHRIEPA